MGASNCINGARGTLGGECQVKLAVLIEVPGGDGDWAMHDCGSAVGGESAITTVKAAPVNWATI